MATTTPLTGDSPITIKISVGDVAKKVKLPLGDLKPDVLPAKLITILGLPSDKKVVFERFSDSAGGFVTLDATNPAVYKTLLRAAKAKLKLRLRAVVEGEQNVPPQSQGHVPKEILVEGMSVLNPAYRHEVPTPISTQPSAGARAFMFKDENAPVTIPVIDAPVPLEAPVPSAFMAPQPKIAVAAPGSTYRSRRQAPSKSGRTTMAQYFVPAYDRSTAHKAVSRASRSEDTKPTNPTWTVYCNDCDTVMTNEHYHCSICEGGDFDLCQHCVSVGKHCPGEGHWLVKRSLKDGQIICSNSQRLAPKAKVKTEPSTWSQTIAVHSAEDRKPAPVEQTVRTPVIAGFTPGAYPVEVKSALDQEIHTRTCNNCIEELKEAESIACIDCEDFDICKSCHKANTHGHHPGHTFVKVQEEHKLSAVEESMLPAGRGFAHNAYCDGCDKQIFGVRHKCLECPDFDFCNDCHHSPVDKHPGHRFVPVYDSIGIKTTPLLTHVGIYCDGPACTSNLKQSYITGVRYKCVICHDTDFCANCEAHPSTKHSKTHPLLKISTPIRGLNISTVEEQLPSTFVTGLGDRQSAPPAAKPESPQAPIIRHIVNSASSVKTIAKTEPSTMVYETLAEVAHKAGRQSLDQSSLEASSSASTAAEEPLKADFVHDIIPDGITIRGGCRFTQVWTMRNSGTTAWPAGCSVHFTGGDNMLNVDQHNPFSAVEMDAAKESNVTSREVQPGEEIAFRIVMKAPDKAGSAISYWRLKSADGTPFGHRLWTDINVRMPVELAEVAPELAAAVKASGLNCDAASEVTAVEAPAVPRGMVFPTLEKESPASSVSNIKAEPVTVEDLSTGEITKAVKSEEQIPAASAAHEDQDLFEDISSEIDVLSASDDFSDDDGFLTDEEYDILDASDQETDASRG